MNTVKTLFALIKSALGASDTALADEIDWEKIYELASAHRITTLVYYGIKAQNAVLPDDIKAKFEDKLYKSTLLSATNDHEVSKVLRAFSENGIYHAPLKGLVVRGFYPRPEMRTVGDADIIIKEEQLDRISEILTSLGFVFDHESAHEYAWTKGKGLLLELHKYFIGNAVREYFDYYKDTDKFLMPSETPFKYEMTLDSLFVFLIVHIAKHYRAGGIGLRHFIDIYVILNSEYIPNEANVIKELEALGLSKFYTNIKKMLSAWFDGGVFDDATKSMTVRILGSGMFGNSDGQLISDMAGTTVQKKLLHDIFLPYLSMKQKYPVLQKCPILLPLFWGVRIADIVLFKHSRIGAYRDKIKKANKEKTSKHIDEIKLAGIE